MTIEWDTRSGHHFKWNILGSIAWIIFIIAVVTKNAWLAAIPAVYILAPE